MNIESIEQRVYEVLFAHPDARNNDDICYLLVLKNQGIDIESISVGEFFANRTLTGYPNFETVRRARQKLQERYDELKATNRVKARRRVAEEEFKEYARGK